MHALRRLLKSQTEAHADPKGASDARPTAFQMIEDEGLVGKLSDKVALVTGGTDGIGLEIVRTLGTGMKGGFTSRDVAKGEKVRNGSLVEDSSLRLEVVEGELKSLTSVIVGAEIILARTQILDVLVSNAARSFNSIFTDRFHEKTGIATTPKGYAEDRFEQQFGVSVGTY
ncbi:hypothetical protein AC579_9677 [Pseudocercospora musae]|uniref:Uncharacterized protein n=1 Tax=Pseudocercospora musae TaxID=113226 RepID=A0A139I5L4_9PEZI|nr:hypothetical protein AC579_9677 [Pseudocercospora musae]